MYNNNALCSAMLALMWDCNAQQGGERQSSVAVGRSPVPLESHSDDENQDRFSAAQAASMSFIDTNMDTATIALSPGNSPAPGARTAQGACLYLFNPPV